MDLIDSLKISNVTTKCEFMMLYGYLIGNHPDKAIRMVKNDKVVIPKYYSGNYSYFNINIYANRLDLYQDYLPEVVKLANKCIDSYMVYNSDYAIVYNLLLAHITNKVHINSDMYNKLVRTITKVDTRFKFQFLSELVRIGKIPIDTVIEAIVKSYNIASCNGTEVNKLVRYLTILKTNHYEHYKVLKEVINE